MHTVCLCKGGDNAGVSSDRERVLTSCTVQPGSGLPSLKKSSEISTYQGAQA